MLRTLVNDKLVTALDRLPCFGEQVAVPMSNRQQHADWLSAHAAQDIRKRALAVGTCASAGLSVGGVERRRV